MNYATILYDPIYATFGVPATLSPSGHDAVAVHVTIIERTSAVDASEQFELGTLRPGAFVRQDELDRVGISVAELDGGLLAFGGRSWRIEAHAPRPGPDGEASGEILMYLVEEPDA